MDITTIIAILVLTALSIGGIVWMEMQSRNTASKKETAETKGE